MIKNKVFYCKTISYVKGHGNYSKIYYKDGTMFHIGRPLKDVALKLSDSFIRIHKSFLINSNFVKRLDEEKKMVEMKCNAKLEISRRRLKETFELLHQYAK